MINDYALIPNCRFFIRMNVVGIGLMLIASLTACGGSSSDNSAFVASWTAAQNDSNEDLASLGYGVLTPSVQTFTNETVRQVAHISVGGESVRIKFSNLYGTSPIHFDKVRLARSTGISSIDPSSDLPLTFNGNASVTIAPGADTWSDEAKLKLNSASDLAVSIYISGTAANNTSHRFALRTNYIAAGDVSSASSLNLSDPSSMTTSYYYLSEVDVKTTASSNVVVAFGDSITDGVGSTAGANLRYPDQLSAIGIGLNLAPKVSVVNQGLGGNRWLYNVFGPSGSSRFAHDVLGVTGVTHTIIFMGINDIGFSGAIPGKTESASQIIAAISSAIAQAQAANIKVFLATITPFKGASYYTEAGEAQRQTINAWIRGNKDVVAVIDFDKSIQDPNNPTAILAAYDSGDHLHPSSAGYTTMAKTVDWSKFQ
jgi:lysophospholipase L1-like esterase